MPLVLMRGKQMRAKQMMGSRNARRALKTFNYRYANGLRYQILIIRQ